jgi:hypothetical protein
MRRWLLALLLPALACTSPAVRVERVDARRVHEELTRNALSTGELSAPSRALLLRLDAYDRFRRHPEEVLAELRVGLAGSERDRASRTSASRTSFRSKWSARPISS